MKDQISNNKIRQIILLALILVFLYLITSNLSDFLPAFLGAITLYTMFRDYYCRLIENRGWKPWLASIYLMLISIVVILAPLYYVVSTLVSKLADSGDYVDVVMNYAETLHQYLVQKIDYNLIDSIDVKKVGGWVAEYSSSVLNTTIDLITMIVTAYFILYFMLTNTRKMENAIEIAVPLKKSNVSKLGDKFRKLIIANVIGIPVVALGQGLTVLIGYLLFGVSSPFFLFVLTVIASVIPIVGGSVVYVPVSIVLLVNNDVTGAIGVLFFGFLSAGVDNVMRFTLLKKIEDIHPLISVFGIVLGLKIFGFIGLIFGPILLSITILLIQVYYDEFIEVNETKENVLEEQKSDQN